MLAGQSVHEVDPDKEYVPPGQLIHVPAEVAPGVALYFPAGQRVQVFDPTAALYVPAWQSVHEFAPDKEYFPAIQLIQVSILCAFASALYVPA